MLTHMDGHVKRKEPRHHVARGRTRDEDSRTLPQREDAHRDGGQVQGALFLRAMTVRRNEEAAEGRDDINAQVVHAFPGNVPRVRPDNRRRVRRELLPGLRKRAVRSLTFLRIRADRYDVQEEPQPGRHGEGVRKSRFVHGEARIRFQTEGDDASVQVAEVRIRDFFGTEDFDDGRRGEIGRNAGNHRKIARYEALRVSAHRESRRGTTHRYGPKKGHSHYVRDEGQGRRSGNRYGLRMKGARHSGDRRQGGALSGHPAHRHRMHVRLAHVPVNGSPGRRTLHEEVRMKGRRPDSRLVRLRHRKTGLRKEERVRERILTNRYRL